MAKRKLHPGVGGDELRAICRDIRVHLRRTGSLMAREAAKFCGLEDGREVAECLRALWIVGEIDCCRLAPGLPLVWYVRGAVVDLAVVRRRYHEAARSDLAKCVLALLRRTRRPMESRAIAGGLGRTPGERVSSCCTALQRDGLIRRIEGRAPCRRVLWEVVEP